MYKSVYDIFNVIHESSTNWRNLNESLLLQLGKEDEWFTSYSQNIIQELLISGKVSIHCDEQPVGTKFNKKSLEGIARRYIFFLSVLAREAFKVHRKGMFSSANGMLIEFTSNIGSKKTSKSIDDIVKRGVFDLKRLDQKFSSWIPSAILTKNVFKKLIRNQLKSNQFPQYIYDSDGRGLLLCILIHMTGILGMYLNIFVKNHNSLDPEEPYVLMKNIYVQYEGENLEMLEFEVDMRSMNYFREYVWNEINTEIINVADRIFNIFISEQSTDIVKTYRYSGAQRKFFKSPTSSSFIPLDRLLNMLFSTDKIILQFWASAASRIFRMFLTQGRGLYTDVCSERFDTMYEESVRKMYIILHDMVMGTVHNNLKNVESTEHTVKIAVESIKRGRQIWLDNVINAVRKQPVRHIRQQDISDIIKEEKRNLRNIVQEEILPEIDVRPTVRSTVESETVPNISDMFNKYRQYEQATHNEGTEHGNDDVTFLVVDEPPEGCLDAVSYTHLTLPTTSRV